MARRMTEEFVTRTLLAWLRLRSWDILSFDYPHSGTGCVLRPVSVTSQISKNVGNLIPDIVAHKDGKTVIFENKVKFFQEDIEALLLMRDSTLYDSAIKNLHRSAIYSDLYVGVGLSSLPKNVVELHRQESLLDFAFVIHADLQVEKVLEKGSIFT